MLDFYGDPDAPSHTKKNPKAWERVQSELVTLRDMKTLDRPALAQKQ